jgi:hypothetical protein
MDFITQVKRPGEEAPPVPTPNEDSDSSSEDEAQSGGLFCCFGKKTKKKGNGKKDKKPSSTSNVGAKGSIPLPLSGVGQRDTNGVNSPRAGGLVGSMSGLGTSTGALLGSQPDGKKGRKCLVLDLDETLVHSSFQEVPRYDFKIPVEIEDVTYTVSLFLYYYSRQVFVAKRPGVDEFMFEMGKIYEIVIFTASLAKVT